MKLLWGFLRIVALSIFTTQSIQASPEEKSGVDFQALQQQVVQVAQQIAVDMGKPLINKSSDQDNKPSKLEEKLPAIVPEKKAPEAAKPAS